VKCANKCLRQTFSKIILKPAPENPLIASFAKILLLLLKFRNTKKLVAVELNHAQFVKNL
jgi:hypothetical protein